MLINLLPSNLLVNLVCRSLSAGFHSPPVRKNRSISRASLSSFSLAVGPSTNLSQHCGLLTMSLGSSRGSGMSAFSSLSWAARMSLAMLIVAALAALKIAVVSTSSSGGSNRIARCAMIFIASSVDSVVGTSHPIINSIAANAACLWCVIPTVRAVSSIIVSVCASRVVGDLFSPLRLNLRLCETALRIVCLSTVLVLPVALTAHVGFAAAVSAISLLHFFALLYFAFVLRGGGA